MTNRTMSLAVVVLLVLGILTSAVVIFQNQQIIALADSLQRISDQAERTFDLVQKRATEQEPTSPGTAGTRRMEPVEDDLIPSGVDQIFLVRRTYPNPVVSGNTCVDYKIVATAGGPAQDVLLESYVGALEGEDVVTEGGGCIDYTLQMGSAGGSPERLWVRLATESLPPVAPTLHMTPGGDTDVPTVPFAKYRNRLWAGMVFGSGRYWVGALDGDTLAVLDLRTDQIVQRRDVRTGRTLIKEAELFEIFGDIRISGDRTVSYETFITPVEGIGTDRRVETWTLPELP